MEFLLDVGIERIAPVVEGLGAQIAEGAAGKGYQVLGSRDAQNGSGIVSFRKEGLDARQLFADLKRENIATAARGGWLRASPHFYVRPGDVAKMIELLP